MGGSCSIKFIYDFQAKSEVFGSIFHILVSYKCIYWSSYHKFPICFFSRIKSSVNRNNIHEIIWLLYQKSINLSLHAQINAHKKKRTRPNNFSDGDPAANILYFQQTAEQQNQHLVTWKFKKKKKKDLLIQVFQYQKEQFKSNQSKKNPYQF